MSKERSQYLHFNGESKALVPIFFELKGILWKLLLWVLNWISVRKNFLHSAQWNGLATRLNGFRNPEVVEGTD